MKTSLALVVFMLVLAVLGAIFYGGYYAIAYLWDLYASMDAVIRIVLLSSMAALLAGSLIVAGAVKASSQAAGKDRLLEAKLNLYMSLIGLYEQYIARPQQGTAEILSRLSRLDSEVMILASNSVLSIHGKLESAINNHADGKILSDLFQQLIKSIRRDLGHGPIYDDSKLKCLITSSQVGNADSSNPGIV